MTYEPSEISIIVKNNIDKLPPYAPLITDLIHPRFSDSEDKFSAILNSIKILRKKKSGIIRRRIAEHYFKLEGINPHREIVEFFGRLGDNFPSINQTITLDDWKKCRSFGIIALAKNLIKTGSKHGIVRKEYFYPKLRTPKGYFYLQNKFLNIDNIFLTLNTADNIALCTKDFYTKVEELLHQNINDLVMPLLNTMTHDTKLYCIRTNDTISESLFFKLVMMNRFGMSFNRRGIPTLPIFNKHFSINMRIKIKLPPIYDDIYNYPSENNLNKYYTNIYPKIDYHKQNLLSHIEKVVERSEAFLTENYTTIVNIGLQNKQTIESLSDLIQSIPRALVALSSQNPLELKINNDTPILNFNQEGVIKMVLRKYKGFDNNFVSNINHQKFTKLLKLEGIKSLFPEARAIKRSFDFFAGPTNSGKTYTAYEELAKAKNGVYLAPLRLMTYEGKLELEKRGKLSSLYTGDDRIVEPNASHICCTVEMADLNQPIECAVLDEVQMLNDDYRGFAWINVILGLPAKRIIFTGSMFAYNALKIIIEDYLNEELNLREFHRFNQLKMDEKPWKLKELPPQSAIIAFSRKDVLDIKGQLPGPASVIYGNLAPGARVQQASLFKEGKTDYLVSTDAIGMGLNLPIKRIVFSKHFKHIARSRQNLTSQEIQQIAGRAGRYKHEPFGYIGALTEQSMRYIEKNLHIEIPNCTAPFNFGPNWTLIESTAEKLETNSVFDILSAFKGLTLKESRKYFKFHVTDGQLALAQRADQVENIDLLTKWLITCLPADIKRGEQMEFLENYVFCALSKSMPVKVFSENVEIPKQYDSDNYMLFIGPRMGVLHETSDNADILFKAEKTIKQLEIYKWLSYRRSILFPDYEVASDMIHWLNTFISSSLEKYSHIKTISTTYST